MHGICNDGISFVPATFTIHQNNLSNPVGLLISL
jgi:hypothetical protein